MERWLAGAPTVVPVANAGTGVSVEPIEKVLERLKLGESLVTPEGTIMVVPELLVGIVEDLKKAGAKDERDVAFIDRAIHYCAPFLHLELESGSPPSLHKNRAL